MTMSYPDFTHEQRCHAAGFSRVAGVDEVGRGPLAGPVMAAAVVLDAQQIPEGLRDSKKLSAPRRQQLCDALYAVSDIGIGEASVEEIDALNILHASMLAMRRALDNLAVAADVALIDGNRLPPDLPMPAETIVKGDSKSLSVAAASIVAKVTRDKVMADLAQHHPKYGWEKNSGYPTRMHRQALLDFGATPHHRRSFAPVRNILYQDKCIKP